MHIVEVLDVLSSDRGSKATQLNLSYQNAKVHGLHLRRRQHFSNVLLALMREGS